MKSRLLRFGPAALVAAAGSVGAVGALLLLVAAAPEAWHAFAGPSAIGDRASTPVAFSSRGDTSSNVNTDAGEYSFSFLLQNVMPEEVEISSLRVHTLGDHVDSAVTYSSEEFPSSYDPSFDPTVVTTVPPDGSVAVLIRVSPSCAGPSHGLSVSLRYRTAGHPPHTQILDVPTIRSGEEVFQSLTRQVCATH